MSQTIAVFGAGPGLGRSVAHRFGREGFRVALVARNQAKLDALVAELDAAGVEAAGFAADLADRPALPGLLESIGPIDVLEYAPAGLDWVDAGVEVRQAGADSFEFPLDLLLRTPAELVRLALPGMLARGRGTVLFGLAVSASRPYPQLANVCAASAAARAYLHSLHVGLAGTGVHAGLLQVGGMVGGSEAAAWATEHWDPAALPQPLDPADLAEALWGLHVGRDRFETVT